MGRAEKPLVSAGFTLLETLTVVAILGILAALILPALSRAKRRAADVQCQSNLRQHGLALQSFLNSHGVFPLSVNQSAPAGASPDHAMTFYGSLESAGLGPLPSKSPSKSPSVYLCPSAQQQRLPPQLAGELAMYGYNAVGLEGNSFPALGLGFLNAERPLPVPESEVLVPAAMIALGDGVIGNPACFQDGESLFGRLSSARELVGSTHRVTTRHSGKANAVYVDGHVVAAPLTKLFASSSEADLVEWNRDHRPHSDRIR